MVIEGPNEQYEKEKLLEYRKRILEVCVVDCIKYIGIYFYVYKINYNALSKKVHIFFELHMP